jgi:hypothetical protein
MAELEVENTLREIRERVLASAHRQAPASGANESGALASVGAGAAGANELAGVAGEALMRMDANLATTARAWSRLPPLLSYRHGWPARIELWLKRQVKRAMHWFTWEQVNFNSATHHTLGDARAALVAHEQALARLQSTLLDSLRGLHADAEADRSRVSELHARLAHAEARFDAGAAQLRQALAAGMERLVEEQHALAAEQRAFVAELHNERQAFAAKLREEQHAQIQARAAELQVEMRERIEGLLGEQRVCFKQLSLEAGEAAVMHDRARRQIEARIEELEKQKQ